MSDTQTGNQFSGVFIDPFGYLFIEGVKVARVIKKDGEDMPVLEFLDRNRRRSACRGTCYVTVTLTELARVVEAG